MRSQLTGYCCSSPWCVSIERCLKRIDQEYTGKENQLETNFLLQDSVMLNLLRACELSIDAAMHLVRIRKLGVPGDARHAFQLLIDAGILSSDVGVHLMHMVGFRNTAIHSYHSMIKFLSARSHEVC